ncbi:MAG: HAD family hydrolase [Magnetospirillum sp.]
MTNPLFDLRLLPSADVRALRFVLCDVDDTLTHDGRLPAATFAALERLHEAGLKVVPVTGGAAGWCDMIARYWPVDAVIGESGAFAFRKHPGRGRIERHYWLTEAQRRENRARLMHLGQDILRQIPEAALAADQAYRECDLAVDHSQEIGPLASADIRRIVTILEQGGAFARVSSIHVNGWFGGYDKHLMALRFLAQVHGLNRTQAQEQALFVGDAPNDAGMFAHFPLSVGVANILPHLPAMSARPTYVTQAQGGHGFAELAEHLLSLSDDG